MQIKKTLIFIVVLSCTMILNVSCSSTTNIPQKSDTVKHNQNLVGGWAPVFFSEYDVDKITSIRDLIHVHQLEKIGISYPSGKVLLAKTIATALSVDKNTPVTLKLMNLNDTNDLKYNHNQVIVTIYFK